MTNEVNTHAGSPAGHEKRYSVPYDLYRRWFNVSEGAWDGTNEGTISSAELEELWKRWFEATARKDDIPRAGNGFVDSLAPLWAEMAKDVSAKMLSGETLPEDPLRFFLQWYNATSERWSREADELLRKDEVLEETSRFFETYVRSHGQFRRVAEEGSNNLRVPTRSDVARVARLIVLVENKVDQIEEAFEEFIHGDSEPATAEAVDSLEERMDRLEGKMDRILVVLEKIEAGKAIDKSITPLESLGLIEAGGAVEDPMREEES